MTWANPAPAFTEIAATTARCVWLDGGGAREWSGRRSILGWLEDDDVSLTYHAAAGEVRRHAAGRTEVVGADIFTVLADETAAGGDWYGYFGYAARPDLPADPADPARDVPDAVWVRPSHVRMFEHPAPSLVEPRRPAGALVEPRRPAEGLSVSKPPHPDTLPDHRSTYQAAFARVQEHLHAGNSYEVNLTYREEVEADLEPARAYLRLRELNPAPYAGFLQHDVAGARAWLLSSSPERYALVGADGTIETKPIKGTTPRADDPAADEELKQRLATEPKFRAENLMITDLLRNDLSMVCTPGTVEVPQLMHVESYENVHQLVTTVRGRLAGEPGAATTMRALRALFPAGSMTGAPKLRTMEIIREVESGPRAAYSGAFGWISADGRADLGVVIRSLTTTGDGRYRLGTGGAITVDSTIEEERAEAQLKAQRLLSVFDSP